jgi:MtN3 and saliva related transmembrane protein
MGVLPVADIVGYLASICMVLGYLPQTYHTIRTRKTDDIAVGTFLLMGIGGFFFGLQGYLLHNLPLLITNVITFSLSSIIFGIKMYNDYVKKRR